MGKIVSFFRHRDEDPGETWFLEKPGPGAAKVEISLYSRQPFPDQVRSELGGLSASSDKAYEYFFQSLETKLGESGGGIIVALWRTGEGTAFAMTPVATSDYAPPQRFLLLEHGHPADLLSLKPNKEAKLPLGSQLLVPIDRDAEEKLRSFVGHLRWLTRDAEQLVLASLTHPSLESRVADLERHAGKSSGRADTSPLASLLHKMPGLNKISFPGWVYRPLRLGLGMLFLTLLLILNTLLIERVVRQVVVAELVELEGGKGPDIFRSTSSEEIDPGDEREPAAKSEDQTLADTIASFDKVLAAFPVGTPEAKLHESHFRGVSPETALQSESFVWGLVKLLALEQDVALTDRVLRSIEERSETKRQLKELLPRFSADGVAFLAAATCSAFKKNQQEDRAGLPAVEGDTLAERVDLPATCGGAEDRINLAAAIKTLTSRLEKRLHGDT